MDRRVQIGVTAISILADAALVLVGDAVIKPAEAVAADVQPQLTFTCQFTNGPRAGQTQSYAGVTGVHPSSVGALCADRQGSSGVTVPDAVIEAAVPLHASQDAPTPATTFTCRFNNGPRAGEAQSYAGVTGMQPIPVGSQCSDGQGSSGIAITEAPVQTAVPLRAPTTVLAPPTTFICRFNNGPRGGQTQSYAGVTGMQPMLVGSQCSDGQGSSGVAIAKVSMPQAAVVQRSPSTPPEGMVFTITCQYNSGPQAGQSRTFSAISAIQPIPVGAPCSDGHGNLGNVRAAAQEALAPPPIAERPATETPPVQAPVAQDAAVKYGVVGDPTVRSPVAPADGAIAPGAAIGAAIGGLAGAVWADPGNTGYVTGYSLKGQYYPGSPVARVSTTAPGPTGELRCAAPGSSGDLPGVSIPAEAVAGRAVRRLDGAVWVDRNNDGLVDGYVYNGRYFSGAPAEYGTTASAAYLPPPPPPPPSTRSDDGG